MSLLLNYCGLKGHEENSTSATPAYSLRGNIVCVFVRVQYVQCSSCSAMHSIGPGSGSQHVHH